MVRLPLIRQRFNDCITLADVSNTRRKLVWFDTVGELQIPLKDRLLKSPLNLSVRREKMDLPLDVFYPSRMAEKSLGWRCSCQRWEGPRAV